MNWHISSKLDTKHPCKINQIQISNVVRDAACYNMERVMTCILGLFFSRAHAMISTTHNDVLERKSHWTKKRNMRGGLGVLVEVLHNVCPFSLWRKSCKSFAWGERSQQQWRSQDLRLSVAIIWTHKRNVEELEIRCGWNRFDYRVRIKTNSLNKSLFFIFLLALQPR